MIKQSKQIKKRLPAVQLLALGGGWRQQRENDPGKQSEVAAAVKQRALIQGNGQRGYELSVYVQLHQIRGHVYDDGRPKGIV